MKLKLLYLICFLLFNLGETFSQPTFSTVSTIKGNLNQNNRVRIQAHELNSGDIIILGHFRDSINISSDSVPRILRAVALYDIFMAKYDATGNLLWANQFGSTNDEFALQITSDNSNNIYISGSFKSTIDFDPDTGVVQLVGNGNFNGFVGKYSANGILLWVKPMSAANGGITIEEIELDNQDNVHVIGRISNTVNFDPGNSNTTLTSSGSTDVFITKYDSVGNFTWAKRVGGSLSDFPKGIALAENGDVYVTGSFRGTSDFDPGIGTFNLTSAGGNDIFLLKLDLNGDLIWAKRTGSADTDNGSKVVLHPDGNLVLFTTFHNTVDFDFESTIFNLTSNGITDIAVIKYDTAGAFIWVQQIGNHTFDWVQDADIAENGSIYFAGYFQDSLDLNPGTNNKFVYSNGSFEGYVTKLDANGTFVWGTSFGGADYDQASYLQANRANRVLISGVLADTALFGFQNPDTAVVSISQLDAFYAKIENCVENITDTTLACDSFLFGNQVLDSSGIYSRLLFTAAGCDSLITVILEIYDEIDTISQNGFVLTSSIDSANYRWLDCNNNLQMVSAADTAKIFTARANGSYTVEVTKNGCVDTANCVMVVNVSVPKLNGNELLTVYPNPTKDLITINGLETGVQNRVVLLDLNGKKVTDQNLAGRQSLQIDLEGKGDVYLLKIINKNGVKTFRILKH